MTNNNVGVELRMEGKVARLVLCRPAAANAINGEMLRALAKAARALAKSRARVVVICGEGKHFCAGADANWMRESAAAGPARNKAEALTLARLLLQLSSLPQPLLCVIQGACYGGGGGLAAVADIVIASADAKFCFSEARLGLIPATISPYIIAAIGERQARRLFLDCKVFNADEALRLGLAHEVAPRQKLEAAERAQVEALLAGGARAQASIKKLTPKAAGARPSATLASATAEWLAQCRAGAEAKEGVQAFLQKRPPQW